MFVIALNHEDAKYIKHIVTATLGRPHLRRDFETELGCDSHRHGQGFQGLYNRYFKK